MMGCLRTCWLAVGVLVVVIHADVLAKNIAEEGEIVNMEIKPETQGENVAPKGEAPPADAPAQGKANPDPGSEANPDPGSEAPRRTDELDWGHTDGADGFTEGAQEAQPPQGSDQEHKPLTGQAVGVVDPEEVMHGDGDGGHDHKDVHKAPAQSDANENAARGSEARHQAETDELKSFQPNVMTNVHDNVARTAAEFMKNQQFGPGDIEEIMHGGHHVHDEGHKDQGPLQGGNVDMFAQGQGSNSDERAKKQHSTIDPEHMMHAGQGDHDHNPHTEQVEAQVQPGGGAPADNLLKPLEHQESKEVEKEHIDNMDIEHIVHGEHNVHHHVDEANYRPKNKVLYQDIIDLGLSEEQLKGIDLNKLLDQEKREFENWQKDEMGNDANDASYWQEQVRDLRKEYLQKIYSKIRELSQPDLDTAEWEQGDDDIRGMKDPQQLHAGESELEHEMEMWGRTEPKENRKAYNVLHGRRGMNEEEGGQSEKKSDEGAEEESTLNM